MMSLSLPLKWSMRVLAVSALGLLCALSSYFVIYKGELQGGGTSLSWNDITRNLSYLKNRLESKNVGHFGVLKVPVEAKGKFLEDSTISLPNVWYPLWYPNFPTSTVDKMATNDMKILNNSTDLIGSRSEDAEDTFALKEYFHGVRNGVVLEMGAMDGEEKSVSKVFERLFQWKSILIDASPVLSAMIPTNRPDAIAMNAAICREPQRMHFSDSQYHNYKGNHVKSVGTLVELAEMSFLRRFHQQLLQKNESSPEGWSLDTAQVELLPEVVCLPLGSILKALGVRHIDFFILDCEGCEWEVLNSLDLSGEDLVIDVLAVETSRLGGEKEKAQREEIINLITKTEVFEHRNQIGRNDWFMRRNWTPVSFS